MENKANLLSLTDENFNQHVLESLQPVLVKFGANWSGPCHIMIPIIEELAMKFSDRAKFCTLNIEDFPETAKKFDIQSFPTLLIFKDGRIVGKATGIISRNELASKLQALLEH